MPCNVVELLRREDWGARRPTPLGWRARLRLTARRPVALAARARHCPATAGVYRLYRGKRLLHIGMAAGAATLRSEVLGHARGAYGQSTRRADRVEWEVAPDAHFAYRRFTAVCRSLPGGPSDAPSMSVRYSTGDA